jgi:hypothetical protein
MLAGGGVPMAILWRTAPVLLLAAALLGGCAETASLAQLPDINKLPQKVLTKEEQKSKVEGMIENGQNHRTEAAKEIEKGR